MSKVAEALEKKFKDHRIVFWYDDKQEFVEHFNELELQGVQKIKVEGNEFEVKHTVNKKFPEKKFLLYSDRSKPANEENCIILLNNMVIQ